MSATTQERVVLTPTLNAEVIVSVEGDAVVVVKDGRKRQDLHFATAAEAWAYVAHIAAAVETPGMADVFRFGAIIARMAQTARNWAPGEALRRPAIPS
jgi:hypothetical protein